MFSHFFSRCYPIAKKRRIRRIVMLAAASGLLICTCLTGRQSLATINKVSFRPNAKDTCTNVSLNSAKYIDPEMVFVQGGSFIMGDNTRPEVDEKPEHKVTLKSFWIGKYEVTVAEFRKFRQSDVYITDAEKNGFSYSFDGKDLIYKKKGVTWECDVFGNKRINEEDHPVIHVSQRDAWAYCAWLSRQTGRNYRLLTEAEWEYAARGGIHHDAFLYSGSDNMEKVGWYAWNSSLATHPVGKKAPNSLGIYDMSGNAWEWCADKYGPYPAAEQTDPTGSDTGKYVVMRGGGWRFLTINTRCTKRRCAEPYFNGSGPGFRLASSESGR